MDVMSIGIGTSLGYPLCEKSHVSCFYDEEHGAYSTWSGYNDERKTRDGSKGHCILMQYTGLKDKNGKEVYEGDVCSAKEGDNDFDGYTMITERVVFVDGSWRIGNYRLFSLDNIRIIGNLYENPELLKV